MKALTYVFSENFDMDFEWDINQNEVIEPHLEDFSKRKMTGTSRKRTYSDSTDEGLASLETSVTMGTRTLDEISGDFEISCEMD